MSEQASKMTLDEAIAKYGDVPLRFESYYKYSFTFAGKAPDGAVISATYGGNADDIYRYSVGNEGVVHLDHNFYSVDIKSADGVELLSHYDYQ